MKGKFRFQFPLAALLWIVTLTALQVHLFALRRGRAAAKDALEATIHEYHALDKTAEDVYRASLACLHAELRIPFGDQKAAYSQHLERMRSMEGQARILGCGNISADPDVWEQIRRDLQKKGDEILPWVNEAERWLQEASSGKEKTLTPREALAEAEKLLQKNDIAGVVQMEEQALAGNPKDASLLLSLARFSSRLASADPHRPDYARYRKAGDYMRRALKANPPLAAIPEVRNLAGPMYYNEACALALDNQAQKVLHVLSEAVEFGCKDLAEIDNDANLRPVRELAGYAEFKTKAVGVAKCILPAKSL